MSASRSWGMKPYRVFPPTCRYRQWPPPQIAVPGSLRLPMILLAFRSHPVVCFPPSKEGFKVLPASPRPGSGYGSHPTEEGFKERRGPLRVLHRQVSIPLRKASRAEEPASVRDVLRGFPSLSDTEHVMANPLSYPVQGAPVPVTVNEVYKRTASSGEALFPGLPAT